MQELSNIYNSLSKESINSLFDNYVVITEKLSGSSFSFQSKNGNLNFYKGNRPITLVDRTLMNYYEDAISHIETVSENLNNSLRFCFQYFVNNKPGIIAYDKLPKNKLVLTHILEMSKGDKIVKIKSDINTLKEWANKFDVSFLEPIFEGYMNKNQIKFLNDYLSISNQDKGHIFERSSFVNSIFKTFNPSLKSSMLQEDLNKPIEAIIFSFINENTINKTKLLDPYTVQSVMKRKEEYESFSADINEVILLDILSFIRQRGLLLNQLISSNPNERYIELISKIFNDYVSYNNDIDNIEIDKAKFANGEEFNLNTNLIKNKKTKENIGKSKSHNSLFKIMLGSLRKKRNPNKKGNVMTKDVIKDFNILIDEIHKGINEKPEEFKTFLDFISPKKEIDESTIEDLIIEENVLKINEFINLGKIKI